MNIEDLRNRINEIGNMKVIFEPLIYNKDLIPKKDLHEILEKTRVSVQGWSFPHIPIDNRDDGKKPYSIGNGVEFYTAWQRNLEIFRFYQSGQFLAKIALREDTITVAHGKKIEIGKYLDFLNIIYRLTEVTLFIKDLMRTADIESGRLTIELHNMKGRELESIFSQNIFPFNSGYVCQINEITITNEFSKESISSEYLKIARDFIKVIFDDFNWKNYSEQMIITHQENIINRRMV